MKKKFIGTPATRKPKKNKTFSVAELTNRIKEAFSNEELFELVKIVQSEAPELFVELKGTN